MFEHDLFGKPLRTFPDHASTSAGHPRTDTDAAIVKWEFPNNLLFPWRSDTIRSLGVIARYNELPARSPDLGSAGCDTLDDLREPINDGSVDPFEPGWVPTYEQMAWIDLDAYEWIFDPGEDYTTAAATEPVVHYALDRLPDGSQVTL